MRGIPRPVIEQFIDALRFRDEKRCGGEMTRSLCLSQKIRMKYILRRFSANSKKIRSG